MSVPRGRVGVCRPASPRRRRTRSHLAVTARSSRPTSSRRSRSPATPTSRPTPRRRWPSTASCGATGAPPSCGRPPRGASAPGSRAARPPGPQRSIHDAEQGTDLPGTKVRGEGDPATGDQGVTEAYDGLGATWALWQEGYGRNSLDGRGLPLVATVHFGRDYDNAFWDGTQMVFGDGDGVIFLPFTRSLDVIGHELAHGVTQYTSGLNYQDQSGALNESVSDVFGVLVKQRLLGQTADEADWLVGAELLAPGVQGVALRSMAAPGHRLRRPPARQGPPAGPHARLRRHHRRQRRRPHQLRHPQQGLPRARDDARRARLGGRRPGLVRHDHRRHQRRLRLRHLRRPHRRRGHRTARGGLRGRRRRPRGVGGGRGVGCRRRTGSSHPTGRRGRVDRRGPVR